MLPLDVEYFLHEERSSINAASLPPWRRAGLGGAQKVGVKGNIPLQVPRTESLATGGTINSQDEKFYEEDKAHISLAGWEGRRPVPGKLLSAHTSESLSKI